MSPVLTWSIWAFLAVLFVIMHLFMWQCAVNIFRRHHESRPLLMLVMAIGFQVMAIYTAEGIRSVQADARRLAGVGWADCAALSVTVPVDGKQANQYWDTMCLLRMFTLVSDWQAQRWNDEVVRHLRIHGRCHVVEADSVGTTGGYFKLKGRLYDQSSLQLKFPVTSQSQKYLARLKPEDLIAFRGDTIQIMRGYDEQTPAILEVIAEWSQFLKHRSGHGSDAVTPPRQNHQVRKAT